MATLPLYVMPYLIPDMMVPRGWLFPYTIISSRILYFVSMLNLIPSLVGSKSSTFSTRVSIYLYIGMQILNTTATPLSVNLINLSSKYLFVKTSTNLREYIIRLGWIIAYWLSILLLVMISVSMDHKFSSYLDWLWLSPCICMHLNLQKLHQQS